MPRGLPLDPVTSLLIPAASIVPLIQTKSSYRLSHGAAFSELHIVWKGACWSVDEVLVCEMKTFMWHAFAGLHKPHW